MHNEEDSTAHAGNAHRESGQDKSIGQVYSSTNTQNRPTPKPPPVAKPDDAEITQQEVQDMYNKGDSTAQCKQKQTTPVANPYVPRTHHTTPAIIRSAHAGKGQQESEINIWSLGLSLDGDINPETVIKNSNGHAHGPAISHRPPPKPPPAANPDFNILTQTRPRTPRQSPSLTRPPQKSPPSLNPHQPYIFKS